MPNGMLAVKLIRKPVPTIARATTTIAMMATASHTARANRLRPEAASTNAANPNALVAIVSESMNHGWLMLEDDDPRCARGNQDWRAQRSHGPAMKIFRSP